MTKEEAREKFKLADKLFNEAQYAPALKVLTELNASFPNERHVLYPMARCLTGLGRNAEALDLADRVARQFDYPPAVELYKRLRAMKTGDGLGLLNTSSDPALPPGGPTLDSDPVVLPPGAQKFDSGPIQLPAGVGPNFDSDPAKLPSGLDSLLERPPVTAVPPPLPSGGSSWGPVALWVGLAVVTLIVFISVGLTSGRAAVDWRIAYDEAVAAGESLDELQQEAPFGSIAVIVVAYFAFWFVLAVFAGYVALKAVEALPFNDFGEDMKDVALYTLYFCLLSILLFIGWLIFLVILRKHYDLSGLKQLAVVALWMVITSVLGFAAQFILGLAIGFSGT